MVILGFLFIIFGGIYFMFWASYKIMTWIPWLLLISGFLMVLDFILDHWILTLVIYTLFAIFAFYVLGEEDDDEDENND